MAIVVFGVFIGLQVSNWNENLVQKEETKVLIKRLFEDLGKEHEVITIELDYYADVKKYAIKALQGFNNEALVKDEQFVDDEQFVIAAYQASQTSGAWSYRSAYTELIRTGNINLIENESLKNLILGYYSDDLKEQNLLLTDTYVEYIRGVMPYEIQDRIRNECGDTVIPVAKSYGYRLPETCDLQLPDELFSETAAYLRSLPDMLKNLQYQLAANDRYVGEIAYFDKDNRKLSAAIEELQP